MKLLIHLAILLLLPHALFGANFRYYRFTPNELRNTAGANSVQLAEFELYANNTLLVGAIASNTGGSSPGAESPAQAVDGDLNTKWLDFTKFTGLVLDFGKPVFSDGYRFATANDSGDRDPVSWILEGSNDSLNWTEIDSRSFANVPTTRQTFTETFNFTNDSFTFFADPPSIIIGGSTTLSWEIDEATDVSIDQGIGNVALSSSISVSPSQTTTYTLTAIGAPSGPITAQVTVEVATGVPLIYDFNEGNLEGWTDLTAGAPVDGWDPVSGYGNPQAGPSAIRSRYHDNPHPTLLLRSPEFTLNGSGPLTAWLDGGSGVGNLTGTTSANLPANSSEPGFQGIALRNAATDSYVLSAMKVSDNQWQRVTFTSSQLAGLDQNATYTLDLIDQAQGNWGWLSLDTVSIPGNLGSSGELSIGAFEAARPVIASGQSTELSWTVINANSVSIDQGIGTVNPVGGITISPAVDTIYTLTAVGDTETLTATFEVRLAEPKALFRYYRFVPTELRNDSSANSIQLGEFQLLFGGVRLDGATAFSPNTDSPGGEGPAQANDNNPSTKWLDFRSTEATLVLDFGESVQVDSYRLATANDSEERDPVSWRVEGSIDGSEWFVLDEQIQAPVPEARITYLDDFTVTTPPGAGGQLKITSIDFSPFNKVLTLTWNSIEGATYRVTWTGDMTSRDTDLETGIGGAAGDSTTRTFDLSGTALEDLNQAFFRVERQ
jgi:hypothetical protein